MKPIVPKDQEPEERSVFSVPEGKNTFAPSLSPEKGERNEKRRKREKPGVRSRKGKRKKKTGPRIFLRSQS